ncbi:MAG: AraC family transcriptional regulator [Niameybacter sp.]
MMITMGADALNINITCPKIILKFGPLKYLYILARPLYPYDLPTGLLATLQIKGVGIYPHPLTLKQLKQAIDDTIIMAYQFFFLGVPCLCTTLTACNHSSILSKLQNGLSTNNLGAIRSTLSELITSEQLKKYDISFAMKLYNLLITHYIVQHQFETEDLYGYNFDELINKFESFSSMLTYLDDVFCEQLPIEDLSHSYNNNFIHILKYVNHYYMHDISIRDVAAELGLNANYISQLFKKETGYTYTKYLTRLRMEKAKQLLLETSLSISDICEQVGYNDYFYFLKTFKKYTGLSPSNYKVQLISSNQKCLSSMSL